MTNAPSGWTYIYKDKVLGREVKRDCDPVIGSSVLIANSIDGPAPVVHYIITGYDADRHIVHLDAETDVR